MLRIMNRYLVEAHAALDGGSERRTDVEALLSQHDDVLPDPAPKVLGVGDVDDDTEHGLTLVSARSVDWEAEA